MVGTTLQKQSEVLDDQVALCCNSWPREARGPLLVFVHPSTRDILLCPPGVEVVCHRANRHEAGDKRFDILER